jgi:hypothetical protein
MPRTGGTHLIESLKKSNFFNLVTIYNTNMNPELKKENMFNADFIHGHAGYGPNLINKEIKTITLLRNPIERVCSYFAILYELVNDPEFDPSGFMDNKDNFYTVITTHQDSKDPIKMFDYWLNHTKYSTTKSNEQSYSLVFPRKQPIVNKILKNVTPYTELPKQNLSRDMVLENFAKLSLVGTTEEMDKFLEKCFNFLNLEFNLNLKNPNILNETNNSDLTNIIFKSLSDSQIEKITEMNSIDFEIWKLAVQS